MTATAAQNPHRPALVWATISVLAFLGVSALAGGLALAGGGSVPPQAWLDDIPLIDSWTVPGLVLGIGFGIGSLVAAYGMWRRPPWRWLHAVGRLGHHWSWFATILIGLGHAIWIALELIYLPEASFLQAVYGTVAVALLTLPMTPPVSRYLATPAGHTDTGSGRSRANPDHHGGDGTRTLAYGVLLLGLVIAAVAALGPLLANVIRYHTSPTTLNQVIGGDAAALAVVTPACLAAAVLAYRRHPAAPVMALPPALYAVYTFSQLVAGQEYLALPGNSERFFPLLYSGFLLGAAIIVTAWRAIDTTTLPEPPRRLRHIAAGTLFAVTAILLLQHLPTLADALSDTPSRTEHLSSPAAFWLVKLMDLGIVAPAALVTGIGTARGAAWARKPAYAVIGAYSLLGAAVAAMAITMYHNNDPDSSLAMTAAFTGLALLLLNLTALLYRPLFAKASTKVFGPADIGR